MNRGLCGFFVAAVATWMACATERSLTTATPLPTDEARENALPGAMNGGVTAPVEPAMPPAPPTSTASTEARPAPCTASKSICEAFAQPFFASSNLERGRNAIVLEGVSRQIESLSRPELLAARKDLEAELERPASDRALAEADVRKMLRGLRYAIGPNGDPTQAHALQMHVVIAEKISIAWNVAGEGGVEERAFSAEVSDGAEWLAWAEREIGYLADLLYVHTWGRVRLDWKVKRSAVPITGVSAGGAYLRAEDIGPLVVDAFPGALVASQIVFVPATGVGTPSFMSVAYTSSAGRNDGLPPGASVTVAHSTEDRMKLDHGWAKVDGGGLLHEFWHQVQGLLRSYIQFPGFIPDNHVAADFELLTAEIASQGLPAPALQYGELYGTFPTWRMAQRIAAFEH